MIETLLTRLPLLVPLGIGDWFTGLASTVIQPLYWAVSGLLVLFHKLWSPVLGPDSGWTWVLCIISLTVVIRTITIPLFVKTIKSSRNMQLVQPKVRELQKKFGHDRERLGQETMKLYREEGVNPMASCGPLLLQMPIFIALFRVLDGASRNIPRGTFLKSHPELVSSLREGRILGARISDTFLPLDNFGSVQVVTMILTILMVGLTFITQLQLTRKNMPADALTGPMAQQQKVMLYVFPLIFGVSGVYFPIGVLIYMVTTTLWTMAQQIYVIRRSPSPGTPAYDAWEARMIEKGRDPKAEAEARLARGRKKIAPGVAASSNGTATVVRSSGRGNDSGRHPKGHAEVGSDSNGASTEANSEDPGVAKAGDRQRIQRQQPQRQTRAKRQPGKS